MNIHLFTAISAAALAAAGAAQAPLYRAQILPSEIKWVHSVNNHGWMVVELQGHLPQNDITLWHPNHGYVYRSVAFPNRRFRATHINDSGVVGGSLQGLTTYYQGTTQLHYQWMARVDPQGNVSTYNVDILSPAYGMLYLANTNDAMQYDVGANSVVTFWANGAWRTEIPVGDTSMNLAGQVLYYGNGAYRRVERDGSQMSILGAPSFNFELGPDGKVAVQDNQNSVRLYSSGGVWTHTASFDFGGISFAGPDRILGGISPRVPVPDGFGGSFQHPTLALWSPLTGRVIVQDTLINPIQGLKLVRLNTHTNESGMVVTDGVLNGQTVNVLLTPVPEPATLAALGLGLAAVARRRRRNRS